MRGRNAIHLNVSPFQGPNATQVSPANVKVYATGGAISGSPIYDKDNSVIFGSEDKYLYRMRYDLSQSVSFLADGRTVPVSFLAGGSIKSTPAIDNSGYIYFGVRVSYFICYILIVVNGNDDIIFRVLIASCTRSIRSIRNLFSAGAF